MKTRTFIIIMIASLIMLSCKKDKELESAVVELEKEEVVVTTSRATVTGTYKYPSELKSIYVYVSEKQDLSDAAEYSASITNFDFEVKIEALKANTKYYYYYLFNNGINTMTTDNRTFTTKDYSLPVVTTKDITEITAVTAESGGDVTDDGGLPITARGICWSTSANPSVENSHSTDSIGTGSFASVMNGLNPGTTYYVKAYATNEKGTAYGEQKSFTTLDGNPEFSTNEVTDITATSAKSGGNIPDDGGLPVTARGICWSTSPNPSISDSHIECGSGTGSYTAEMTGLSPNTTYYVCAYAQNDLGLLYAEHKSFTTLDAKPVVETAAVSNVDGETAKCGGTVLDDCGFAVTARGVCWSTSADLTIENSAHTTDGSGTGTFESEIMGLSLNTTYYVKAYATNEKGTAYGEQRTFSTVEGAVTVTTDAVSNITVSSATCGGNVTDDGGLTVTARGVCWSTSAEPTIDNSTYTTDGSGEGHFTSYLTDLNYNTTYYVKAYATNSAGTFYGEQRTFSTGEINVSITTDNVSDITGSTATCGGNITDDGGMPITARGVCWSTSAEPTTNDSHTSDGSGEGHFTSYLTGLSHNTTYYVRAYAVNGIDTYYGNTKTFTTSDGVITLTTSSVSNITTNSAVSGGNITDDGGMPVTARGVCWSTSAYPTPENSPHTVDGTGEGAFTSNLTNLTHNTTYYVRAYATNATGIYYYGDQQVFSTLNGNITVITKSATNITINSAQCGGTITNDGGAAVTARGICWSTSQNPTIEGLHTTDGQGLGEFTSYMSNLSINTTYYVKAYATNSTGTYYGNQVTFSTRNGVPTIITSNISNITGTEATSGGNISDDGGSPITARGVCWSTSSNPTISDYHTVDGSGTGSFTSNMTGLTTNTTYYVKAYAINSTGTYYGEPKSFVIQIINGHEFVDLGLPSGLKWATCNVGSATAEGYGNYYAWGETQPKSSYTSDNSVTYGESVAQLRAAGIIDAYNHLTPEYDAATANWGGSWRMPTKEEEQELIDECTWQWTTQSGVNGYRVTGPNGKSIFLPAAGGRNGTSLNNAGENGYYWSSAPNESTTNGAYYLSFNSSNHYMYYDYRYYGFTVRPVSE